MILQALLELIFGFLRLVFGVLPAIPGVGFLNTILTFVNDILSKGVGLLCFFVRPGTLILALGIFSTIFVFQHSVKFVIWVLRKIPFINVG